MLYERSSSDVTDHQGRTFLRQLLQWLLPCPCLGCGDTVWRPRHSLGLCLACRRRLLRWPSGCQACGQWLAEDPEGLEDSRGPCDDCLRRPPPYEQVLCTWCYLPPLDEVITGFKFRRLDYLGEHLGRALAEIHRHDLTDLDLVLPVPLAWTRRLKRGYNQAALIARPLARHLGFDYAEPMTRRRSTTAQSRLDRDHRLHNLDQAFVTRQHKLIEGKSLLLIDDVLTTGATLSAAASCLKQAGARSVVVLTAARTPTENERNQLLKR